MTATRTPRGILPDGTMIGGRSKLKADDLVSGKAAQMRKMAADEGPELAQSARRWLRERGLDVEAPSTRKAADGVTRKVATADNAKEAALARVRRFVNGSGSTTRKAGMPDFAGFTRALKAEKQRARAEKWTPSEQTRAYRRIADRYGITRQEA